MSQNAMFAGMVYDENDTPVTVAIVGGEAHYVVDDFGFKRHIEAAKVDREVMTVFLDQLQDNKGLAVEQALRMMGKDDLFTKAAVDSSIDNINIDDVVGQVIPPQARDMMAMFGLKIIINVHGELVGLNQPTMPLDDDDDDY